MANAILHEFGASTALTISLASIADQAGRQSTPIDNETTRFPALLIYAQIKMSGSVAPTAYSIVEFYLIRYDDASWNISDDNAGASDAAWPPAATSGGPNAQLIGSLREGSAPATNDILYGSFYVENPGPGWAIGVINRTGQALNSTGSTHVVRYVPVNPSIQ